MTRMSLSLSFESRDEKYVLCHFPPSLICWIAFLHHRYISLSSSSSLSSRQEFHSHLSREERECFLLIIISLIHSLSLLPFSLFFSPHSIPTQPRVLSLSPLSATHLDSSADFSINGITRETVMCVPSYPLLSVSSPTSYPEQGWWLRKRKAEHPSFLLHLSRVFFLTIIIALSSFWPVDPDTQRRGEKERGDKWKMR